MPDLAAQGVVAVATSFVDNSGISRVKAVPLDRLPSLAGWGVGFSTAFDCFRFDDWVAAPATGEGPVGDQRIVPDLDRLVVLAAQPGWAWAPGERYAQTGEDHDQDSRLLLRAWSTGTPRRDLTFQAAFEIEWVVSAGDGDEFSAAVRARLRTGPARRRVRLLARRDHARSPRRASWSSSSTPSTPPGSSSSRSLPSRRCTPPTPRCWCGRRSGRSASGTATARRTPRRWTPPGVGNGGHVHLSLWRDGQNLMSGGTRLRAHRRGGGVRRRRARAPAGAAGDRRTGRGVVPPAGAAALGRRLRGAGAWRTARPRCGW